MYVLSLPYRRAPRSPAATEIVEQLKSLISNHTAPSLPEFLR